MADRIRYRKLPGSRRGFFKGASAWLGPDHLLLVHSMRFREEYKRYQLRDIQAIAIANRPRFHISTRAFAIAILWAIACTILSASRVPHTTLLAWILAAALVLAWFYVSAVYSCTCRIYTAVSRDELPSVYRTWVATEFLRVLEPQIAAVQGDFRGDGIEAVNAQVGPRETLPADSVSSGSLPPAAPLVHQTSSYVLTAALLLDGLWHAFVLYHPVAGAGIVSNLMVLAVIGAAILVLIQHRRGKVGPAHQWLAIAALTAMGLVYYVRVTVVGALTGARAAMEKKSFVVDFSGGALSAKIEMGITLALGLAGLIVLLANQFRQRDPEPGGMSV